MLNKKNSTSGTSSTLTPSKKRPVLKAVLIFFGTIAALITALVLWIYIGVFAGPDLMELSEFHPFRSPEAREHYLTRYAERERQWPVAFETRMIETSYGQTFVRISGPADAPPLVLLSGAGSSSLAWQFNIEALSENYRTYAVDNIYDFGRSVFTKQVQLPDDYVIWLDELFTELDFQNQVHLLGLSYGGWIAGQYALSHPERLERVVLLAPAATVMPLSLDFAKHGILTLLPHRYFVKRMMYWILEDLVAKDAESRAFVETAIDDSYLAMRSFKFKLLVNPTVLTDEEWNRINARTRTLFIVGELEKIYPAHQAVERIHTAAPDVETEIITDAGHGLFISRADLVNERILRFLHKR